jgi:hypothetical protein
MIPPNATGEEIEFRRQRFVTTLADRFASSIAREQVHTDRKPVIVKLWGNNCPDRTIKSLDHFRKLFAFLNSDPSTEEFVRFYEEALTSIPEDRHAPFTSLYNHLCLTGKIARVLEREVSLEKANSGWMAKYRGLAVGTVEKAHGSKKNDLVGSWKFSLIKLYVGFPHFIVRLQDLNILGERCGALQTLAHKYPDNVLYFTEDFALLFFPEWRLEILVGLEDFRCRIRVMTSDLTTMSSVLDTLGTFNAERERRHGARVCEQRWPTKATEIITGSLCTVCQQRPGTQMWTKGILEELLCARCLERRNLAARASTLVPGADAIGTARRRPNSSSGTELCLGFRLRGNSWAHSATAAPVLNSPEQRFLGPKANLIQAHKSIVFLAGFRLTLEETQKEISETASRGKGYGRGRPKSHIAHGMGWYCNLFAS